MSLLENINALVTAGNRLASAETLYNQAKGEFDKLTSTVGKELIAAITWQNATAVIAGKTRYIQKAVFPEIFGEIERQMDFVPAQYGKNSRITMTFKAIPGLVFTQTAYNTIVEAKIPMPELKQTGGISFICSASTKLDKAYKFEFSYNGKSISKGFKLIDDVSVLYAARQELMAFTELVQTEEIPKQELVADLINDKIKLPAEIVTEIPFLATEQQRTVINSVAEHLQVEITQRFTTTQRSMWVCDVRVVLPVRTLYVSVKVTHTFLNTVSQDISCVADFPVKPVTKEQILNALTAALDQAGQKNKTKSKEFF
jgi:hypothetical protein